MLALFSEERKIGTMCHCYIHQPKANAGCLAWIWSFVLVPGYLPSGLPLYLILFDIGVHCSLKPGKKGVSKHGEFRFYGCSWNTC